MSATVWYLLVDHECKAIGSDSCVHIPHSNYVDELRNEVKQVRSRGLAHVDAADLIVWRFKLPNDKELKAQSLISRIKQLNFVAGRNDDDVERISSRTTIKDLRLDPAETLIIQTPNLSILQETESPAKKRKLDPEASINRCVNIAPSVFAKPSTFRSLMEKGDEPGRRYYIFNRPIDFSSIPLNLISPCFDRLSQDMFGSYALKSEDFGPARDLTNVLSELKESEGKRKVSFQAWVRKTLGLPKNAEFESKITFMDGKREAKFATDGHEESDKKTLIFLEEVKPERGESVAEPDWQMMSYIRAYYMQERPRVHVGKSCLPTLCLSVNGPCIDMSGAIVHPDGTIQMQVLTPSLRVDCDVRDDDQRNLLARFVRALRSGFQDVKAYHDSLDSSPYSVSGYYTRRDGLHELWYPYVQSYSSRKGGEYTFKYKSRIMPDGLVFLAESIPKGASETEPGTETRTVIVKFTKAYSIEAHELLSSRGFAPELFVVQELTRGWKMIVMEYLDRWDPLLKALEKEPDANFKAEVEKAIQILHDNDIVHGDARGPNIFARMEDGMPKIKLIDFDYCGKNQVDVYPREWNHMFRQNDAKEGDPLQKKHDDYLLDRVFDNSTAVLAAPRGYHNTAPKFDDV